MSIRFQVKVPAELLPEATYVLDWVLSDRFGFARPKVIPFEGTEIVITSSGMATTLRSPCIGGWGVPHPGKRWTAFPPLSPRHLGHAENGLPVLFGEAACERNEQGITLKFDLWGTLFWLLAGVDEVTSASYDAHGRFLSTGSYLRRAELLLDPVADSYVEFLRDQFGQLWPEARLKNELSSVQVTCDVDFPHARALHGPLQLAEAVAADLFIRKSLTAFAGTLRNVWSVKRKADYRFDPNNTFDWIMDQCEHRDMRATFFFISSPDPSVPPYNLSAPYISGLLSRIDGRGHEIGLHGVNASGSEAVHRDLLNLKSACQALAINKQQWGNRQHYLRWRMTETPDALEKAGIAYDSSLSFADHVGFRCGTCHDFPLWSWSQRRTLAVREVPLIAMDVSLTDYMGLDIDGAIRLAVRLKQTCRRYKGTFVLLWHNSNLRTTETANAYQAILDS